MISTAESSTASVAETVLRVEGMMCGHCTSRVQQALEGVAGVQQVSVDLDTKLARVVSTASSEELIAAVEATGKSAELAIPSEPAAAVAPLAVPGR